MSLLPRPRPKGSGHSNASRSEQPQGQSCQNRCHTRQGRAYAVEGSSRARELVKSVKSWTRRLLLQELDEGADERFGIARLRLLAERKGSNVSDGEEIEVEVGESLRFAFPSTPVDLPWTEIGEVRREPSFRGQWRLVFYRPHGARLASANGSYREVKRAWIAAARWLQGIDPEATWTGDGLFRDD